MCLWLCDELDPLVTLVAVAVCGPVMTRFLWVYVALCDEQVPLVLPVPPVPPGVWGPV